MRAHWKLILVLGILLALVLGAVAFWFLGDTVISNWFLAWARGQDDPGAAEYWYQASLWKDPVNTEARLAYADYFAEAESWSQAETLLGEGIELTPENPNLYMALSGLYVAQDKLMDAAAFLDNVTDPVAKMALQDMRPGTPHPSHIAGEYHEKMVLSFQCDATTYIRTDGTFPSTADVPVMETALEEEGEFTVMAVSVGENGLVSIPYTGTYLLTDLVFEMTFADPAVETIVRMSLGKDEGPVLSSEARQLTHFTNLRDDGTPILEDLQIRDLSDLPILKNLTAVTLILGPDVDLTPLTQLPLLTDLALPSSGLDTTDIAPLAQIATLQGLDLSGNQVSTLSVLEGMTNLTELRLSGNNVADVTPLGTLTGLQALDLSHNAISDLSGLSELTGLYELNLGTNLITDVTPLVTLNDLQTLDLSANRLSTAMPLREVGSLVTLDLHANQIDTLEGLDRLTKLQKLNLSANLISDLTEIGEMVSLTDLDVSENQISDLTPVGKLQQLQSFTANKNNIKSVKSLADCAALTVISVEYNKITDLSPLSELEDLSEVRAFENPLEEADLGEDVTVYYS